MRNASHSAGKTGVSSTRPEPDLRSEFTRRRFLFALGAGGAGAAAAAASPAIAAPAAASAPVADASSGYRETEHIRDYYDSARI